MFSSGFIYHRLGWQLVFIPWFTGYIRIYPSFQISISCEFTFHRILRKLTTVSWISDNVGPKMTDIFSSWRIHRFQIGWKHSWHTGLLLSWEIYIRQLHSPPRHPGNFMNSIIPHLAGWTWVRHGYPTPSLNTNSKVPPLSFQAEIAPQKKRIIQIYLATFHSQLNSLLVSGRGIFRNEVVKPQHLNAKNQLPAKTKNELQLVVPKFSWICFFLQTPFSTYYLPSRSLT